MELGGGLNELGGGGWSWVEVVARFSNTQKILALTLMYFSIFFLDHFEKCEIKCSRKRKSTRPVENVFKPYFSKIQNRRTKTSLLLTRMSKYHQTKNGVTKINRLLFCIRVLKVQIWKSYVFIENIYQLLKSMRFFFLSTFAAVT